MAKKPMKSDRLSGVICPWCVARPPIMDCPHNPFKLMHKVKSLEELLDHNDDRLRRYQEWCDLIKDMVRDATT